MMDVRLERNEYRDILQAAIRTPVGKWQTITDQHGEPSDFSLEYDPDRQNPSAPRSPQELHAKCNRIAMMLL